MTELPLNTDFATLTELDGECAQIKSKALQVIDRLGATIGILEESLEEVCDGNCAVCPVQLKREGKRVVMNMTQTTIYGITTGWENLINSVTKRNQDS